MTAPKNATTRKDGKRFYSWRNENYWSVTTIIDGGIPKPALINWAKKYTAEYAVDNFTALTELVAVGRDDAVDWLKGAAYRDRDRKADIGTSVHLAIEAHRLGKPMPPWPLEIRPRMAAFERFVQDFDPVYEATEASVYNRTQRYAGTLDAIITLTLPLDAAPRRFVLDAKSGKGIYPEVGLQLAAYRYAEFIGLPDGSEAPMPSVDGALALHLTDHGYRLIEVRADEQVFQAFLYAREIYRWGLETSKTVLGQEYGVMEEVA